ncbi:tripartite tricarboxylate transporter substrate-binding protein [Variovorax sp. J22R133]|uniref:tripartite tricarboxylate transporter substrate-binding protein n=1 Tax=Variovorax brevis TaxID=3053503 RepID=UPI002575FF98|nr:tripartite tricarboxylate transporter substrate-binding protein [Variovorax sp. J22R133]MDM0117960.1 tripartite tricarboxylate transporter substrate-binding protein [Variovorax sp. J22R133]
MTMSSIALQWSWLSSTRRSRSARSTLPNVPTVAEQGYPNFEAVSFIGMMAPAATPKPIIDKSNADIMHKILAMPEIKDKTGCAGLTAEVDEAG